MKHILSHENDHLCHLFWSGDLFTSYRISAATKSEIHLYPKLFSGIFGICGAAVNWHTAGNLTGCIPWKLIMAVPLYSTVNHIYFNS